MIVFPDLKATNKLLGQPVYFVKTQVRALIFFEPLHTIKKLVNTSHTSAIRAALSCVGELFYFPKINKPFLSYLITIPTLSLLYSQIPNGHALRSPTAYTASYTAIV